MNRVFRAVVALVALAVSWPTVAAAQYQAIVLADAPVAYYRLEEVAGTSALDSSGNGHTGTYTSGPLLAQAGLPQLGLAVSFDGIDDHVVTARTVATDFTLELWLLTTATSPVGTQAYQGAGLLWADVGGSANDFVLAALNDRAAFFTGNPDTTVIGTTPLNDGRWHHVVATRTMGGAKQLYVDAVLEATGSTNGSPLVAQAQIMVGGNTLDSRYFKGLIDEVAYYNAVLSPAQIQAHFAAGTAPVALPPVAPPPVAPPPAPVPTLAGGAQLALLVAMVALGLFALRLRA
jgi:hypothetical protein